MYSICYARDKNHNPRKGTETIPQEFIDEIFLPFDKNHNPRKGTETGETVLMILFFDQ